jgi:hypothetical protein
MKLTGLTLSEAVKLSTELRTRFRDEYDQFWIKYDDCFKIVGTDIDNPKWEVEHPSPRPKTEMRWHYNLILDNHNKRPFMSSDYYKDEAELRLVFENIIWFERIEESGREFPVFE